MTQLYLRVFGYTPRTVGTPRELANPYLDEVHYVVNQARSLGWLTAQPCEVCGAPKAEAHHDDYDQPFLIRWLCRLHHRRHHAARKAS